MRVKTTITLSDLKIINRRAKRLNKEAADVLTYQNILLKRRSRKKFERAMRKVAKVEPEEQDRI
jgi:hypothetical protein